MSAKSEVFLDASLDAVPRARELLAAALEQEPPAVREDAELVISELVANAVLHGRPPISVRVLPVSDGVRVEVEDCSRTMPVRLSPRLDATTGRGLGLVSTVAARWGVDPGDKCKVVWAEVTPEGSGQDPAYQPFDVDELLAAWAHEDDAEMLVTVRLGSVPTDLLLAAKAHIDSVVRELTLSAGLQAPDQLPPETAALVDAVTHAFARAREEVKRQAVAAAVRGDAQTELVLHLPAAAADAGERYLAALDEADRWARAARLLTLAAPRSHQIFRRWYVGGLVDQLRAQAAGEPAPLPRPFPQVLADEVDRLSHLEEAWHRLQLLEQVTSELASATTERDIAQTVLDRCARILEADSGRVYLITPENTLRSIAVHGGGTNATEYVDIPLDAELPGPHVVRTRQTLLLRNLEQLHEQFPAMASYDHGERTLHVAPLAVADRTLGVFALTWMGSRNIEEEAQVTFVSALADALAQALERVRLTRP